MLPPQDRGNNPNSNNPQAPGTPRQPRREVIQDVYDDQNYTLARPSTCPTERFGALENATLENKPTRKDGIFQKKNMKIAAVVLICFVIVGGAVPVAILLTNNTGITNIFYFI